MTVSAAPASAQVTPLELDRARLAVHEAGFDRPRDHAAIWHVIQRRASRLGVSEREMIRRYSGGRLEAPRNERTRWVMQLGPEASEPDGWPDSADWERFRPMWRRVLRMARAFSRGAIPDPCAGRALHWGGMSIDVDRIRARRAVRAGRWSALDCGPTRNAFFAVR